MLLLLRIHVGQNLCLQRDEQPDLQPEKEAGCTGLRAHILGIERVARAFAGAINRAWLDGATLVPVPPSKAKGDAGHDDRMVRICDLIARPALDVRELVVQRNSLPTVHEFGHRPSVEDLLREYQIDESLTNPAPHWIGVFDDVLTAGTHFIAMKRKLVARFPGIGVQGFFIARRVFPNPFEEIPSDDIPSLF